MKMRTNTPTPFGPARLLALVVAVAFVLLVPTALQAQTPGGTQIQNRASASYSDGTNNYTTVSNTVTVTVANVSGLAITPDAGSIPTVVSGQTGVDFTFTVTNTSNFATQVRFLQNGASIQLSGPATIAAAVIDANNNGIDGSDPDIAGNTAGDVLSASVARNASLTVIVRVNVNAAAAAGANISVRLGDSANGGPTFDNQVADNSAGEVRTSSGASAPVNGESEARGDISTSVQNDAQLRLGINAPAGPVALGSNITYTWTVDNTGQRPVAAQTLNGTVSGAPAGANNGVFVVVPVPAGTSFVSASAPGGMTVLYSNSALGGDPAPGDPPSSGPLSAATTWSASPSGTVTRIAFNVGPTLGVGASVTNLQVVVQISASHNASLPIYEIGDAFGRNSISAPITDQSGDTVANKGDGSANYNEPKRGVPPAADEPVSATQGYQVPTTLVQVGNVLIGPNGFPDAVGPTNNNDDYTNKTVPPAAIAGLGFGDVTTSAVNVDYTNTIRNTGNANDTFTITAPTVPAGFTVQVNTGSGFVTISGGGSTTLAVLFNQQANITVRVTAPAGTAVLNNFDVVIRATSGNTATSSNDTIDRLYTGFLRLQKSVAVIGGGPAIPGADIEYTIAYSNISSSGGTNNVTLTASSIVITEDGNALPNNWGTTTTQVVGSASDSRGGTITGDAAGSNLLTDSLPTLGPGQSGTFKFRRKIK